MAVTLAIFALFIVLASGLTVIFPSELLSFVREAVIGPGVWWAAGARLLLAVLLWFSAPDSRTPNTFKVLAVLAVMAALFLVTIGPAGMLELVDWLDSLPHWVLRLQSMLGVAFGVFLLWSLSRKWAKP